MPKFPGKPEMTISPFSIVSQLTGPPFAHSLNNADQRKKLMQKMDRLGDVGGGAAGADGFSKVERPKKTRAAAKARRNKARP